VFSGADSQWLPALILTAFGVAFAAMWIIALFDLVQRAEGEFPSASPGSNPRLLWSVIVVLFGGIGGFVYYLLVMKPSPRPRG
jgi:lysylphosphatidylglycerol synthetase-like protein (DUF2156 family)